MKKIVLFSAVLFFALGAKTQAQDLGEDITPSKYVFANLESGELYPFGGHKNAWWPDNAVWPGMTGDGQFEGFLGINNGSDDKRNEVYIAGTSILDMGEEIGNVLCIRGMECPSDIASEAPKYGGTESWNVDALMYSFCTSNNPNDTKPNVIKLVMKVLYPSTNEAGWGVTGEQFFRIYEHTTGDLDLGVASEKITLGDFGKEDEWLEIIFKYNHSTKLLADGTSPKPTQALILNFAPSTIKNCAVLIKELSFYNDPTFTDEAGSVTTKLLAFGSSTKKIADDSKITYTLNEGIMSLENLNEGATISVYSLSGMLVNKVVATGATQTVSLDKGYFTVSVDGQNFKVLN